MSIGLHLWSSSCSLISFCAALKYRKLDLNCELHRSQTANLYSPFSVIRKLRLGITLACHWPGYRHALFDGVHLWSILALLTPRPSEHPDKSHRSSDGKW